MRKKTPKFILPKKKGLRASAVLTAYSALEAKIAELAGVDVLLVGDSLGPVVLGYKSTHDVTEFDMLHHLEAVNRGRQKIPIVVDLPLRLLKKSKTSILKCSKRFIEAGADAVKIEWHDKASKLTLELTKIGIPVIGHIGYTPQMYPPNMHTVRGRTQSDANHLSSQAKSFEDAGATGLVLECVITSQSKIITKESRIPTIGIGSGLDCDAQVLVYHDVVGLTHDFDPKFLKRYADSYTYQIKAIKSWVNESKKGQYPTKRYSYTK